MTIPKLSQIRTAPIPLGFSGVWKDLREGWAFIFCQRWLAAVVLLSVMIVFVTLPAAQLIPALANGLNLTDPTQLGTLWSGMTLGMFLGALYLNSARQVGNKTLATLISALLCAGSSLMIGLGSDYLFALSGFILMGFSLSLSILLSTTLFQAVVPKEMQGRFFGNTELLTLGLQPLVMGLAGLGADWSSAATIFTLLGSGLMIFGLVWMMHYREYLKLSFALPVINSDT